MNTRIFPVLFLLAILLFGFEQLDAQCAMCKQVVDSGNQNGSSVAKGLNNGILYLLTIPFLAVGTVSYAFWRRWKTSQK